MALSHKVEKQLDDWHDPRHAEAWDAEALERNPTRAEQLDILLALLDEAWHHGSAILDIGVGSGRVAELILERLPDARLVGVDFSQAMMELGRRRLERYGERVRLVEHDLESVADLALADDRYSVAVTVQTLHNLSDEGKRAVIDWTHDVLEPEGLLVIVDRIAVPSPRLYPEFLAVWGRLAHIANVEWESAPTYSEHLVELATRGDRPATLEQHLDWLREAGFEPACLHLHANRALIAARSRETA